ncbi:clathrin interactor EPSIN 2-like [Magnolia sinica]|uniref:clathrin interactor EPSIN 2-like n=1 Tax=Magnolia sinica TaxID=86752 RepID=UPI002659C416|nr:clathrin interactor EPSIN 2-like [Magnolia sinica]
MKKVFDQTVRDLKREVNKKVLKVPGIEQKVLDATSNEPWGPHGSHLADIAQATRNYNEYQMIMAVLWKRINDTGKNWRHVYKALTVLEYLVAHGSERVIDEIREHAYQISTLSDFQYIDSSGRDQGSNVRKKSQAIVVLVNDKERIQEVRQKALANRDKYRGASATGGMYRPSSYSSTGGANGDRYDDDRYGYRDDDRNGYAREREWGNKDDDRYGRGGDSYGRGGDRYGRDSDERYGRDGYRDDDYRGNRSNEDDHYGSRSRSSEREKDRPYEDDDRYSSRSGGGRPDDRSPDERRLERKLSEQNVGAPPTYEEATTDAQNHTPEERDGRTIAAAPKASSPTPGSTIQTQATTMVDVAASSAIKEVDAFDEFDPRASVSAAPPPTASTGEVDLFGAFSDSVSPNALALVPVASVTTAPEPSAPANSGFGVNFVPLSSASTVLNQPAENPFGDPPFKAIPVKDSFTAQPQGFASTASFQPPHAIPESSAPLQPVSNFEFADTFQGITYAPPSIANAQFPSTTSEFPHQVLPTAQPSSDFLDSLLSQSGPAATAVASQAALPAATGPQMGPAATPVASHAVLPVPTGPQMGPVATPVAVFPDPTGAPAKAQPPKDKFETKSTVWTDTLSRGLVNLNISGPKINPLADIGIDFDSINRMEKRKEKSSAATVTSTITMGKAMGSGSGIGRAGATGLAPPPGPMLGNGMGMGGGAGMGMGMGNAAGMGMGGYGGMNRPMGMVGGMNQPMGMGMGMGMNMGMGMGMNMGMAQGAQMRPAAGLPPSVPGMPSGYNPMMGMGGYTSQQPYGGYR